MSKTRVIDPLNRIEGDMAIEITIGQGNRITDARSLGFVYRGLENIFIGKRPFDAMRLSQRACGVCPVSHGTAGARAIERAAGVQPPRNAQLIRDIVLGANIMVSHGTHFYFMWGPDLVNEAYKQHPLYGELVKRFAPLNSGHLRDILREFRIPLHAVVATFGGKFPHPMHAVPGGVTCVPKHIELIKTTTRLSKVQEFVEKNILGVAVEEWLAVKSVDQLLALLKKPSFADGDVGLFVRFATDVGLHKMGEGHVSNFLAYGFGEEKDGSWLFKPGYVEDGTFHSLEPDHISEDTSHAYYEKETQWRKPIDGVTKPIPGREGAYSWIKAARYFGNVCELGPLARQIVNGDPLITDLVAKFGVNTFTRTVARLHETVLILPRLLAWIGEIDLRQPFYNPCPEPKGAEGVGLVEAPRGALGHWVSIDGNGLCKSYQIITPTTWNASPRDSKGQRGAIEQALIGVTIRSPESILEAGHIVRGFDPCISCSIHSVGKKRASIRIDAPCD